ncbi:MAG: NlpC/P60 family protein [Chitinophagales bacterium]
MNLAYCNVSISPLRKENKDSSEMISQLLFGETCEIIHKKKNWCFVKCSHDNYEGWLDEKQITELKSDLNIKHTAFELVHNYVLKENHIPILIGSSLPNYDGLNFKIENKKYLFQGLSLENNEANFDNIRKIALKYLHAPYLWGGRSPFGIDCSGLTQIVYKFLNKNLPRDAYQQAEIGDTIGFLEESKIGDLAYFGDLEKITHVGIIIGKNQIIHASGKVRIDTLDHLGIYNNETSKYTHKLRIIKRIIH